MRNYADSLYYMFTPFLFAIASSLLIIAHYIYVEKVPKESVNSDDDDGDQALLDSDANSESFRNWFKIAAEPPSSFALEHVKIIWTQWVWSWCDANWLITKFIQLFYHNFKHQVPYE